MTTDSTLQLNLLEKIDIPVISTIDSSIEMKDFSVNNTTIQISFSALTRPYKDLPQVVTIPYRHGFYWLRADNEGWTDNIDARGPGEYPRPLEGFDFEHKNQYIYNARRAQLVALTPTGYVAYDADVDASRGGTLAYSNDGPELQLYFYLNDRVDSFNDTKDFYFDNSGSANCVIAVFPLP